MTINKYIIIVLVVLLSGFCNILKADEGMWLPMLISKYNIADMKEKGFKLQADDIYSINKACIKDAVVLFGSGCTAEMISTQGLLITNHHCGYGNIQSHSSPEKDYLTNGFWAMNQTEELNNPGLTATFLIRMEDVTSEVLKGVADTMPSASRSELIRKHISDITTKATDSTHYQAEVEAFFEGNQYFLVITEVFKDVRLVGAPPSSIGKFGGDTDNWMWPRHTGDFSLFRIYADKNNKPADYAPDNVPYKPKKAFTISLGGIKKGDFTMVLGYPARTNEYLSSYGVDMIYNTIYPHSIAIRQEKLDLIAAAMNADTKTRIQYSAKQARISNAWKKWIGARKGLRKLNAIEKKQALESEFNKWAATNPEIGVKYGGLTENYKKIYAELTALKLSETYLDEVGFSSDLATIGRMFIPLINLTSGSDKKAIDEKAERLKISVKNFHKDYNIELDKKLFKRLITLWTKEFDKENLPNYINDIMVKSKEDPDKFIDMLFHESILLHEDKIYDFLDNYSSDKVNLLFSDVAVSFYSSIVDFYYEKVKDNLDALESQLDELDRLWMKGLMEMQKDKVFYPNANFTMRLTYGKVDNYNPHDAVEYDYYTTLEGILEKDDPDVYDYKVPGKLKQLFHNKDYGQYGENGKMHVCFIASNHTSGGNSGSPVINANGHLIGINFDRNWEGTMSDYMYDPNQCRNISLDIRYALFIIDKFAGASYLIDEMNIEK